MKFYLMQQIDKIVGPYICSILTIYENFLHFLKLKNKKEFNLKDDSKILVLKFWGMGSIILAIPGIKEIKKFFPKSKIYFLTLLRNKEIIEAYSDIIDEGIFLDIDKGFINFFKDVFKVIIKMRRLKLDLLIDLEFFTRFSAIISYLSNAKNKAGFASWEVWRGFLHNITVPFNRYWHVKKNFINLIFKAVGKEINFEIKLVPPSFINYYNYKKFDFIDKPYICINPNSGELALERRWPLENFIRLIKNILNEWEGYIILLGSKKEKEYVEKILKSIKSSKIKNLAGSLSFNDLVLVISKSALLITNDSGPLHLAAALDVSTISFFGPETPLLYGPIGNRHFIFFKNLDCSPCINVHTGKIVRCIKTSPECMSKITVEEVWEVVKNKIYEIQLTSKSIGS
ncbi:MAG: glycosyltransferase family 9 protein [Endomicrobia bacterium]|nr:glycosyltransferase family 9 protein [Endomicrobiia bacterium]